MFKRLLFFICLCGPLSAANIVFDLHGVLFNVSYVNFLRLAPKTALLHYFAYDVHSLSELNKDWYAFLDLLEPETFQSISYDPNGQKVPAIMTSNLKAAISCQEVCERAQQLAHSSNTAFKSQAHRDCMLAVTCGVFTPTAFIKGVSWFNDMIDLVIEYKKQGHKVFILSNLNDEHFALLKATYPYHIGFFDGVVISGLVKMAKPEPAIYDYLLKTYQLDPAHTIFIDDQLPNCKAAEACGIASIHCPQKRTWQSLWLCSEPDAQAVQRLINLALKRMVPLDDHNIA